MRNPRRYCVRRRRRHPPAVFPKQILARLYGDYAGEVSADAAAFGDKQKVGIYKLVRIAKIKKSAQVV